MSWVTSHGHEKIRNLKATCWHNTRMANKMDADTDQRLCVMQSFRTPRATTNPYIHMLDTALGEERGIEHLRFDRKRALFGKYDVLHFHWPETLLDGTSPLKVVAHKVYASALLIRLRLSKITVVRTVHNVALPKGISRWERWFLKGVEKQTDYHITLNEQTVSPNPDRSCVIPHGHYIDWFSNVAKVDAELDTLGFVGLIRRYKGVETLIEAFEHTRGKLPNTTLRICGNPTSDGMREEVERLSRNDVRVQLDLRYLSEEDFAKSIMQMRGVILPYRFMHNSGAVLAALSLDRPVLVPDNDMNRTLSVEVGPGWVHFFHDDLTPEDIVAFREAVAILPDEPPRLNARGWSDVGLRHAQAYLRAAGRNV